MRRRCLLHIGRHKTGSSAIQAALYRRREDLKQRGYLYPLSGLANELNHQNIAWAVIDGFWALMLPVIIVVGLRFVTPYSSDAKVVQHTIQLVPRLPEPTWRNRAAPA